VKLHWWLRLRWYEWRNAWRAARMRRTTGILSWSLPCALAPLVLRIVGANTAKAAQDWVLSFDIPLALLLAVVVTVQATPATVRATGHNDDAWIFPLLNRRLVGVFQWLRNMWRAARWPLRFALAGIVLGIGSSGSALVEWLLIALLAFVAGIVLARVQAPSPSVASRRWAGDSRGTGFSVLSTVPLRAAWRQLDLRRMLFLSIPILLAAPMGTPVYKIALGVAAWMPLVYLATCCREAGNAVTAMRRWLPLRAARLHWWVWRHVVLLIIASAFAAWALWHFTALNNLRSKT
jgi:hypothetical protein